MYKFFFTTLLLLLHSTCYGNNLPDLGSPDLIVYDAQTEKALGQAFSTELNTKYPMILDPESLNYVREIGHRIVRETKKNRHFKFYIVDDSDINAFAGPNGIIGINAGLIMAADSEDELASVMAHEIAHVTQNHLSRAYHAQKNINITSIATLIAAILIGTQDASAGIATFMGGMGLSIEEQLRNSRAHEHEADYFGIDFLAKAGYNPYAMGDFFGKLSKASQLYEFKTPELLRTHPVTETRLAQAQERAYNIPFTTNTNKTETLNLIKTRLHIVSNSTRLSPNALSKLKPHEQCYLENTQAMAESMATETNPSCLTQAQKNYPNQKLLKQSYAQTLALNGDTKSLQRFKYLEDLYPNDPSILLRHSQALAGLNRHQEAIQLILNKIETFQYKTLLYYELANLHAKPDHTNNLAYSYYYSALANVEIGNLKNAKHLLDKASGLSNGYNIDLKRKIENILNGPFQDDEISIEN